MPNRVTELRAKLRTYLSEIDGWKSGSRVRVVHDGSIDLIVQPTVTREMLQHSL